MFSDFGRGFYTTPNEAFARDTGAFRVKARLTRPSGQYAVLKYILPDDVFVRLNSRWFIDVTDQWAQFIIANRCRNPEVRYGVDHNHDGKYDLVIGSAADGQRNSLAVICDDVSKGKRSLSSISTREVYPSNSERWGTQWSFHTPKAVSELELVDIAYYELKEG